MPRKTFIKCTHPGCEKDKKYASGLCGPHGYRMKKYGDANDGYDKTGDGHHLSKLDAAKVRTIRSLYATGHFSQMALGEAYDVSTITIQNILYRKTWKHVP